MARRPAYQIEPVEIRARSWETNRIDAWDLFRILAWKSANGNLASLSLETTDHIETVTRQALTLLGPYADAVAADIYADSAAWSVFLSATDGALNLDSGLRSLKGVALPSATAVLAVLNPQLWAVLDVWSTRAVFTDPPSQYRRRFFSTYEAYLERLVELQRSCYPQWAMHGLDQELMRIGKAGDAPPFRRVDLH